MNKDEYSMVNKAEGWDGVLCYKEGVKIIYQSSGICTDGWPSDLHEDLYSYVLFEFVSVNYYLILLICY